MSEQIKFTEENKKTVVAFITGLLVGGLLVYIFANPAEKAPVVENTSTDNTEMVEGGDEELSEEDDTNTTTSGTSSAPAPVSSNGEGAVEVMDQEAGDVVVLESVEYPADAGWVGVRDYENGRLVGLLGVSRWSVAEGLLPQSVNLLRATEAGKTYAVVFFSDNGDKGFSLATDVQFSDVSATFVAQ